MAISREDAQRFLKHAGKTPTQIGDALGGPAPYASKRARANAYGAKKCESGFLKQKYDSRGERGLATRLWAREHDGKITDLQRQVRVELVPGFVMKVDFTYIEDGERIYHEYKGFADQRWHMQIALWQQIGPGEYRVTMQKGADKVIRPKPCEALVQRIKELHDGR